MEPCLTFKGDLLMLKLGAVTSPQVDVMQP